MILNTITFADMAKREGQSFMGCEESFITMKLIQHGYLIPGLDMCVHETPTETELRSAKCGGVLFNLFQSPWANFPDNLLSGASCAT